MLSNIKLIMRMSCSREKLYVRTKVSYQEGEAHFLLVSSCFTMTTPISSHVKDKNNIFTAHGEEYDF